MSAVVRAMSEAKARDLFEQIGTGISLMATGHAHFLRAVADAKAGNAHEALGYPSWTAYLVAAVERGVHRADVISPMTPEQRRELVATLTQEGMSTRAIAAVVGVNHSTVVRDRQVVHDAPPDEAIPVEDPPEQLPHAWDSSPEAPVRQVVGLDGRSYAAERPERRAPRRQPLNRAIFRANYDLQKVVGRLDRLTTDDRLRRMDAMDREKAKNELARLQKVLFDVRQRLSWGAS